MEILTLPPWVVQLIEQVGPFAVILLVLFWYVPRSAISSFVEAQQKQAIALANLAAAVDHISKQETRIEDRIDEVLINQRLFVSRLEELKKTVIDERREPSQ